MADEIMLPRLGAHLHAWGSGHACVHDTEHDGDCYCECGIVSPYDAGGDCPDAVPQYGGHHETD